MKGKFWYSYQLRDVARRLFEAEIEIMQANVTKDQELKTIYKK